MSTSDFLRKYADDEEERSVKSKFSGGTTFATPKPREPMNPRHPFAEKPEISDELMALCAMCGVDCFEIDEYYMVFTDIWHQVPVEFDHRQLCIGCLEEIIGRKLEWKDFSECPLNYCASSSERLTDRLGKHFRFLDESAHDRNPIAIAAMLEEYKKREALSDERQRIAYAKVGYDSP